VKTPASTTCDPEAEFPAAKAGVPAEAMFSTHFRETSPATIVEEVRRCGYWSMEEAIGRSCVDALLGEIDFDRYLVNTNALGVVCAANQRFLSHCLAASKKAYDLIVSKQVLEICRAYFPDCFKLTNQRIYQTHTEGHMPWHTDNNCQSGNALSGKHQLPGLLFLIYLSDVQENAFQILKNSHEWSKQHTDNYFSDQFIETHHAADVVTFHGVRGTLFVCDIHAIHRAEPFKNRNFERFTLLFQVDAVSDTYRGHGEKLLVNTAFVDRRDAEVLDYLGFGAPADYPTFPNTSAATMCLRDLWSMQKQLLPMAFRAAMKMVAKALLPGDLQVNLKRWKWRLRQRFSGTAHEKDAPRDS